MLVKINESKELRQKEFYESISSPRDEYSQYLEKIPENKLKKIRRSVANIKSGIHASAPLTCLGPDKCPFIRKCPIPDVDKDGVLDYGELSSYPIGKECVMEKFLVEQKIVDYLSYLDVDPSNPVEMSIVNELALIDLYKNRCLFVLSSGDGSGEGRDFLMVDITGFNENGVAAETKKLHPVVEMIDKLEKRRERWLERLMETRKSKADFMMKMGENQSSSRVLSEIQKLREVLTSTETVELITEEQEILLGD